MWPSTCLFDTSVISLLITYPYYSLRHSLNHVTVSSLDTRHHHLLAKLKKKKKQVHDTYPCSGPEEPSELRALVLVLVLVIRCGGVGRGATSGPAAELQVLPSVNCMVTILRPAQRLDQVDLLPGSHKATASAGNKRTNIQRRSEVNSGEQIQLLYIFLV